MHILPENLRFDARRNARVTRDDNDNRVALCHLGRAQHLHSADGREIEVSDNDVEGAALQGFERLAAGSRSCHLVAVGSEHARETVAQSAVVLDDKNANTSFRFVRDAERVSAGKSGR